eukprot:403100_1
MRCVVFKQIGYPKCGIAWTNELVWFTFWPKQKNPNHVSKQMDKSQCAKLSIFQQMFVIYSNIDYLPAQLFVREILAIIKGPLSNTLQHNINEIVKDYNCIILQPYFKHFNKILRDANIIKQHQAPSRFVTRDLNQEHINLQNMQQTLDAQHGTNTYIDPCLLGTTNTALTPAKIASIIKQRKALSRSTPIDLNQEHINLLNMHQTLEERHGTNAYIDPCMLGMSNTPLTSQVSQHHARLAYITSSIPQSIDVIQTFQNPHLNSNVLPGGSQNTTIESNQNHAATKRPERIVIDLLDSDEDTTVDGSTAHQSDLLRAREIGDLQNIISKLTAQKKRDHSHIVTKNTTIREQNQELKALYVELYLKRQENQQILKRHNALQNNTKAVDIKQLIDHKFTGKLNQRDDFIYGLLTPRLIGRVVAAHNEMIVTKQNEQILSEKNAFTNRIKFAIKSIMRRFSK